MFTPVSVNAPVSVNVTVEAIIITVEFATVSVNVDRQASAFVV